MFHWFSTCGPGIPGDPQTQEVCEVKTIFIVIIRHYLSFLPSFSYEYTVVFSRGYTTYSQQSEKPDKVLLPFLTTYLKEVGFFLYTSTKKTFCNKLNAEADIIQLFSY